MNDELLQRKINELSVSDDYLPIIREYFETSCSTLDSKYELVEKTINRLWNTSRKNPSQFSVFKPFEQIMQKDRRYRDHLIHSYNVFLLGYYLMKKLNLNLNIERLLLVLGHLD